MPPKGHVVMDGERTLFGAGLVLGHTGGRTKPMLEWACVQGHYNAPNPADAVVRALRVHEI